MDVPISETAARTSPPGIVEEYKGEPEDLDLPQGKLEGLDEDEPQAEEPAVPPEEETLENVTQYLTEVEDIPVEDIPIEESIPIADEKPSPEDTTPAAPSEEERFFEDVEAGIVDEFEEPESAPPKSRKAIEPGMSTLEQLEALTADEPQSLDRKDILEPEPMIGEEISTIPVSLDDELSGEAFEPVDLGMEEAPKAAEMKVEGGEGDSVPLFDELSIDDSGKIDDAESSELSGIDMGQFESELGGEIEDFEGKETGPEIGDDRDISIGQADGLSGDEIASFNDFGEDSIEEAPAKQEPQIHDFDLGEGHGMDQALGPMIVEENETPPADDTFEIEKFEDEYEEEPKKAKPAQKAAGKAESVELTEREMRRFKEKILHFDPGLRGVIKETILNDSLPAKDIRQLVDMVLSGKSESAIHRHLEKKLGRTITLRGAPSGGRRVITSRPEYTPEGRERTKKLLLGTWIAAATAISVCLFSLLGYQFIYKPYKARQLVKEGVALILKRDAEDVKVKNYNKAEELLKKVNENYIEKYIYGEVEYGKAYLKRKEYYESVRHFNKGYAYDRKNKDVLNGLGLFYSRVHGDYYAQIQPYGREWYFKGRKEYREMGQLDLAVDFYQRVLALDPKNLTALHGIGNAYFLQKQYLKAKRYYENILKLDPDSVVGYSGLLNLYVDRDAFEQVISIHSKLNEKKMLPELPSPLLAKVASYYLGKQKSDMKNVRIDYGMTSPRFKDDNDNLYPAIQSVIAALNKRDAAYPPLYLQSARFGMAQKNYKLMKRHLEKALSLEPNYFAALSMSGEYYLYMRDPVKAFDFLRRAIRAHSNPPDFTGEDFYEESEKLGRTYALMGNVFYYYFDRIDRGKVRFGDLEDDIREQQIEGDIDRMANYNLAGAYYEKALSADGDERFESPELHYNLGRIHYLNTEFEKALDQWLNLYDDFVSRPELMLALGNAFYHNGDREASKGEYLKLISVFEREAERIRAPIPGEERFIRLFGGLSTAYNNLGAVYQLQRNEKKSHISYWKAIDYAKRIETENEFARVNLARSIKMGDEESEPILDENIPFSLDIYREDMRK